VDDADRRAKHAIYMREYNRRNRERLSAQRKARYQDSHPPRPRLTEEERRARKAAQGAAYYRRNREELSAKAAARYARKAEEVKAKVRAYQQANPEGRKAYRVANRDRRAAQARAWREAHPEQVAKSSRAYYEANAEQRRAEARAYYATHREERRAAAKEWRLANPDKLYAQWARKRLKRNPHDTVVQEVDRQAVYVRDGGICQLCGEPVSPGRMTMDHKTPLTRGGAHSLENLQLAHRSCNSRKGTRTMEEWLAALAA
jgi:5-methylcytosine-specific restriction endonuclease McrA